MKIKDIEFQLRQKDWCVSFGFGYFNQSILITTREYSKAHEWCSNNLPLGMEWRIEYAL